MSSPRSAYQEDVVARARTLVPVLKRRYAECRELRGLPDDTVDDLRRLGLLRILQPAAVGGGEAPFATVIDVSRVLATGCPSTAWTAALFASSHWILGMFPREAQQAVWADPDALVSSSFFFPRGRARKQDDGFLLSGRWPFCAGMRHAKWMLLGGIVRSGELFGEIDEYRMFVVPTDRCTIHDVWRAEGLEGLEGIDAGEVEASEIFVPAGCSLPVKAATGNGQGPGAAPLYRLPLFSAIPYVLVGPAFGAAETIVSEFLTNPEHRVSTYYSVPTWDLATVPGRVAEASAAIAAASRLALEDCGQMEQVAAGGDAFAMKQKVSYRFNAAFSVGPCGRALDLLFDLTGAEPAHHDDDIQRAFRDLRRIRSIGVFNLDRAGTAYGRALLGQSPDNPTL